MLLGIQKTKINGIVSLIVPYEWVYRPSTKPIRDFIRKQGWSTHIYRFKTPIFDGVDTTASISLIDKSINNGQWNYYNIDRDQNIRKQNGVLENSNAVLGYEKRVAFGLLGAQPRYPENIYIVRKRKDR